MNIFPIQWRTAPLDNIVCLINGDRGENYPSKSSFVASGVPFINAGHLTGGDVTLAEMNYISEEHYEKLRSGKTKPNDILFCLRGSVGKIGVVGSIERAAIASSLVIVRTDELMCNRYIYHYLRSPLAKIESELYDNGTAQPNLGAQSLGRFSVPIAPRQEQTRIAEKLDTVLTRVDACRDRLARVAPLLKRFRQSVLAAATSGRLTVDFGLPSRSLHQQMLGNLCAVLGGKRLPKGFDLTDSNTGFPYVRVVDFYNFTISVGRMKYVPLEAVDEIRRYVISSNDVYISIAGSIGLVGQVPVELDGANLTENAARIVAGNQLFPRFLMYQLASPQLQDQMHEKKIATTQDKLGLFRIKELAIWVPSLKEQTEIVRRVETLFAFADRLEARLKTAQTAADRLTPALLAKAFRGELVPQDPNDEPAAELLKRLATSRDAAPKAKRGRRSATADTTP